MKTILAGSREITDKAQLEIAIQESGFIITEVVSGTCRGVDKLGENWADDNGIPISYFPAEWGRYGKAAGPKRNKQMARYADQAIVVRVSESRGAKNMIQQMRNIDKPVFERVVD